MTGISSKVQDVVTRRGNREREKDMLQADALHRQLSVLPSSATSSSTFLDASSARLQTVTSRRYFESVSAASIALSSASASTYNSSRQIYTPHKSLTLLDPFFILSVNDCDAYTIREIHASRRVTRHLPSERCQTSSPDHLAALNPYVAPFICCQRPRPALCAWADRRLGLAGLWSDLVGGCSAARWGPGCTMGNAPSEARRPSTVHGTCTHVSAIAPTQGQEIGHHEVSQQDTQSETT